MASWLTILVDVITDLPIVASAITQILDKFKTVPAQTNASVQAAEQTDQNTINQTGRPE